MVFQLESREGVLLLLLLLLLSMRGEPLLLLGLQLLILIAVVIPLFDRRRLIPRTLQESASHIVVDIDIDLAYLGFDIFWLSLLLLGVFRCYSKVDVVDEIS